MEAIRRVKGLLAAAWPFYAAAGLGFDSDEWEEFSDLLLRHQLTLLGSGKTQLVVKVRPRPAARVYVGELPVRSVAPYTVNYAEATASTIGRDVFTLLEIGSPLSETGDDDHFEWVTAEAIVDDRRLRIVVPLDLADYSVA